MSLGLTIFLLYVIIYLLIKKRMERTNDKFK
nr:MAG TPA: Rifin [Caudoviricetes sp.]